jgi:hypothetical protein
MYFTHTKNLIIHLCGYNSLAARWGREYANRSTVLLRQRPAFSQKGREGGPDRGDRGLPECQLNFVRQICMPLRIDGAPRRLLVKLLTIRYGKVILRIGLGYCK